jgi:hypothetical protein
VPAAPPDSSEACRDQQDGRRLGHCGCKFGDHDFAALEIGYQDLVYARVEGAAAAG